MLWGGPIIRPRTRPFKNRCLELPLKQRVIPEVPNLATNEEINPRDNEERDWDPELVADQIKSPFSCMPNDMKASYFVGLSSLIYKWRRLDLC